MTSKTTVLWMLALLPLSGHVAAQAIVPQAPTESAAALQQQVGNSPRVSPRQRAELSKAVAAEGSQQEASTFLDSNRKQPGVKVLPNGVQYKILKAGSGKKPLLGSSVRCHLEGTLVDGTSFDKVEEKAGTSLLVKGLVPGLQSAVTSMPVGSKWQIVVPPALGFGDKGSHNVGPNAVLIYQFELLAIK